MGNILYGVLWQLFNNDVMLNFVVMSHDHHYTTTTSSSIQNILFHLILILISYIHLKTLWVFSITSAINLYKITT